MPPDEAVAAPTEASPATETPTPPSPETAASEALAAAPETEFAGLGEDFDDDTIEVELPVAEEPVTEAQAEEQPPAKPTEAKPAEAKPAEQQPPKAPEGQKEPAAEAAAPPAPSEPRNLVEWIDGNKPAVVDELAKTTFAWDEGEKKQFQDALDIDASQALVDWAPKLAARIYTEAVSAALKHIQAQVPGLVMQVNTALTKQKDAEQAFFSAFPVLNREKHWNDIVAFANVFRQQNPKQTEEALRQFVGAAVMAKYGLAAPPAGRNGAHPKPAAPPFVPAQSGGGVTVTKTTESPWEGLGQDFDD